VRSKTFVTAVAAALILAGVLTQTACSSNPQAPGDAWSSRPSGVPAASLSDLGPVPNRAG